MNIEVCRKWYAQGVREFGQPAQHISWGAFLFVNSILEGIANQMGTKHTAPLDCEALLVDMQTRLNRASQPHLCFTVPGPTSASSAVPSHPSSAVSSLPSSVPPTSHTVLSQPSASSSYAVPPPLQPQPALSRKRRSQDVNDEPQKQRKMSPVLFSSCSDVEPDSPVHRPRPRPRRKLIDIDEANCVQNRTRAARTPTELYQEPAQANWGRNGTEANAIAGFLPLRRPLRPQMSTCTICYCQLTHTVDNTTANPALCVHCGRYKSRNVSIICMRRNKRYIFYSYK